MNFESHRDEFAFFLRFLSFSPLFFQMLIFMCHKIGQKCDNMSISPITENQGKIKEVKGVGTIFLSEGMSSQSRSEEKPG